MAAPLAKQHVTSGSQIILPAYPILFLVIAGFFLFQDEARTRGPAFEIALLVAPIHLWGALFLVIGTVEVFSFMSRRRGAFMGALVSGSGLCAFWSVLLFASATQNDDVSWTDGALVLFVAVAQIASVRSLARDDVRM